MQRPVISLSTYQNEIPEHSHDDMWQLVPGSTGIPPLVW